MVICCNQWDKLLSQIQLENGCQAGAFRVRDCVCLTGDSNMKRQQAVSMKINKYLLKADELYQTYLTGSDAQVTWNRWGVSENLLSFRKYQYLLTTTTVSFTVKKPTNAGLRKDGILHVC